MIVTVFLIVSVSGIQLRDKETNMEQLFNSFSYGKKRINKNKRRLAIIYATILIILFNVIDYTGVNAVYGPMDFNAKYGEIILESSLLSEASIGIVYIVMVAIEILISALISVLICFISERRGVLIQSILIEAVLFIFPALIMYVIMT